MSQRPSSIKGPYLTKVICNWKSWHKKKVGLKHTWRRALAIIGLYTLSSKWPFDPPTVIATWFPMTCKLKEIVNYDFNPKDKSLKSSKNMRTKKKHYVSKHTTYGFRISTKVVISLWNEVSWSLPVHRPSSGPHTG